MSVDVLPTLNGNTPEGQLRDYKGVVSTGGRLNAYRALLPRSKMANVSCRAKTETGDNIVINGFILRAETTVVIRGIGPSLAAFGVSGSLADPLLELFNSTGASLKQNDNWKDSQQAEIQATGLAPTNDLESAIIMTLPAGAYTAQLRGVNDGQGVALTEVYELSPIADPAAAPDQAQDLKRTQNLSSRVIVRGGDQLAILGMIVSGRQPGTSTPAPARRLIFRARGPSTGVPGALADPQLELYDVNGNLLAQNNDWQYSDANATVLYPQIYRNKIAGSGFQPGTKESVIIATLPPGAYTLQCRGRDSGQGIAIVEAFEY
jgi:hypothetical protein